MQAGAIIKVKAQCRKRLILPRYFVILVGFKIFSHFLIYIEPGCRVVKILSHRRFLWIISYL